MTSAVRFTDLATGKNFSPATRTEEEAEYVYRYAAKVATARFLVEMFRGDVVVKSKEVGIG